MSYCTVSKFKLYFDMNTLLVSMKYSQTLPEILILVLLQSSTTSLESPRLTVYWTSSLHLSILLDQVLLCSRVYVIPLHFKSGLEI